MELEKVASPFNWFKVINIILFFPYFNQQDILWMSTIPLLKILIVRGFALVSISLNVSHDLNLFQDNEACLLDILDTYEAIQLPSEYDYCAMREQYERSSQGFLILFDVTNSESFSHACDTIQRFLLIVLIE